MLEHVLRGILIAALAVMLWQSLQRPADSGGVSVRARGVGELTDWSSSPKPLEGLHLQLDSVPKPRERAWLGALSGAGTSVTWDGDVPAVMIDAQPVASPTGGTRVLVAAPSGSLVVISDVVGPIDTVSFQLVGASLALRSVTGELKARTGGTTASTFQRDSISVRKILVIGNAGWESKFVVAGLEEEGWKVDAFIRVAPSVDVTQGSSAAIDTSRYSAVVALDDAASPIASRIIDFARAGGGVVLGLQAASVEALSSLRSGMVGRPSAASGPSKVGGSVTFATLPVAPVTSVRSDAVPLERQGQAVTTAARRVAAGRVIQLGYNETWPWRVSGGESALSDHRRWWSGLVASIAHAPSVQRARSPSANDQAPILSLVTAIGSHTQERARANVPRLPSERLAVMFLLLTLSCVWEVASRRLRGAA